MKLQRFRGPTSRQDEELWEDHDEGQDHKDADFSHGGSGHGSTSRWDPPGRSWSEGSERSTSTASEAAADVLQRKLDMCEVRLHFLLHFLFLDKCEMEGSRQNRKFPAAACE